MFKHLRDWLHNLRARQISVTPAEWVSAEAEVTALKYLDKEARTRLRTLTVDFIAEKEWSAAGSLVLTPHIQLVIGLHACLLILNLGLAWYRDWRGIIVYPESFTAHRSVIDETGIVHEYEDTLLGEAWDRGPIIVSWFDARRRPEGVNPMIHEFAHALDLYRGSADGMPRLHPEMSRQRWADVFNAAFQDHCTRVDGGKPTVLDPYAAEAPAEFFAVASEVFFDTPTALATAYPQIFSQLKQFYRQDPLHAGNAAA